jgi:hypothetical protein
MAAALAAFYAGVKIGHVEAGLRTFDKNHPYPEEANRRIIDAMADVFFAHSEKARGHLLREGIADSAIAVTGNTVILLIFSKVMPYAVLLALFSPPQPSPPAGRGPTPPPHAGEVGRGRNVVLLSQSLVALRPALLSGRSLRFLHRL